MEEEMDFYEVVQMSVVRVIKVKGGRYSSISTAFIYASSF